MHEKIALGCSFTKLYLFPIMFRESYGLKEAGLLTYSYPKDKSKLMMSKVFHRCCYITVDPETPAP
jgi:hypothetical protein